MKKALSLLIGLFILTGCAETMALLGPASSLVGGGNVIQSGATSAMSYGVKKSTGKSPMQHAVAYAKEKNPNKKKDRCLSFVKKTDSEACYIAKKQISSVKKATTKKIENAITSSKNKIITSKNVIATSRTKIVKKIKTKQKRPLQAQTTKEDQLKSIESIFIETAISKKQASHLRVSIEKSFKINDLSK
jgi:hypothetical protein